MSSVLAFSSFVRARLPSMVTIAQDGYGLPTYMALVIYPLVNGK